MSSHNRDNKNKEQVATSIARQLGVDFLWKGDGIPEGHDIDSWPRCIAAAGMYIRGLSITHIAEKVDRTRQTVHRWMRETPDAWQLAMDMNRNEDVRALEAKARLALDASLDTDNENVRARTAKWVLERTDTTFLDPKYKTFNDPDSGQVGLSELNGVSSDQLRQLLKFVRNGGDLSKVAKQLSAKDGAIDITPHDEDDSDTEQKTSDSTRSGRDLADMFFED